MINTIIFDLDGTLIESLTSIVNPMNDLLEKEGYPSHSFDSYRMFLGDGVEKLVERAFGNPGPDLIYKYTEKYMNIYMDTWRKNTIPFDGIMEMLKEFQKKRVNLMILSNKRDDLTKIQVNELFPKIKFFKVKGAVEGTPNKPDPSSALEMLNAAGIRSLGNNIYWRFRSGYENREKWRYGFRWSSMGIQRQK